MSSEDKKEQKAPRIKPIIEAADSLSLGISIVVAILMGVGMGILLKNFTGAGWTLWIGVFIGIAAAVLNVYKAYSKQYKEYEELAKEPRYAIKKQLQDDEDEDESEKNY
ncbi:AtpZ/AtpI family protein [Sulfurimonas sp.]|jgi:F0F1-type ATP synthase assembly protein I|uniref:AtpZ/AtpI family protein n=1 Tax=Sulfurimonas sp. TaxID=2022749 RepID=UPI0025EECAF9|nr:AtpZ/AtpI family protein [Sulfurimonas sp.]MCK9473552.1 AtpZ/AtpI family protein [Sulfurimonas sp.]MDD3506283.1 AtpZ/AtpI family protein [Sulfurimonas sp.]